MRRSVRQRRRQRASLWLGWGFTAIGLFGVLAVYALMGVAGTIDPGARFDFEFIVGVAGLASFGSFVLAGVAFFEATE